ncbi:MAG: urea amidolyase, partial [Actinomycetota bacterium]
MIRIIKPGPATTIQDQGRTGHQHLGVPCSGPFDPLAAIAANRCVGNGPDAPLLEATLIGPSIQVDAGTTVAVIGTGIQATLCERELIPGEPRTSQTEGLLQVRSTGHHIRFPIAFRGGIVARSHLGSVSQLPRARLGNPPLRAGDEFELGDHARLSPIVLTPPSLSRR